MNNAALESNSSTSPHYERTLSAARDAASALAELDQVAKARMLRSMAKALDVNARTLVPLAAADNALTEVKLRDDLRRATVQLRILADIVSDGTYLEADFHDGDPDSLPAPRPDLRGTLVPTGPVAIVLGASTFPFTFGLGGVDTASALAAGCPVVAAVHPNQPRLTTALAETIDKGLRSGGAPDGSFGAVHGANDRCLLVQDPRITAVGYVGSMTQGHKLDDLAAIRPCPVPFYGVSGSIDPVFVTHAAATNRAGEISGQFLESLIFGADRLCSKPRLLFVPEESTIEWLTRMSADDTVFQFSNYGVRQQFLDASRIILAHPHVRPVSSPDQDLGDLSAYPIIGATDVQTLYRDADALLKDCHGPFGLIVTYASPVVLHDGLDDLPDLWTATVHGADDDADAASLLALLRRSAVRIHWNEWPTGATVSWARHHGDPYSAADSIRTSVGPRAIRRFLRPIAFDTRPEQHQLQVAANENHGNIPRRAIGDTRAE